MTAKLPPYIVRQRSQVERYQAIVRRSGKMVYVGSYRSVEEAVAARDAYCTSHGIPVPRDKRAKHC